MHVRVRERSAKIENCFNDVGQIKDNFDRPTLPGRQRFDPCSAPSTTVDCDCPVLFAHLASSLQDNKRTAEHGMNRPLVIYACQHNVKTRPSLKAQHTVALQLLPKKTASRLPQCWKHCRDVAISQPPVCICTSL